MLMPFVAFQSLKGIQADRDGRLSKTLLYLVFEVQNR